MEDLKTIDTSILLDMLAKHTETYTSTLQGETGSRDFAELKRTIDLIQKELSSRRQSSRQTA